MTKAKWRRKLAVLLSICVLGTSGAVPDPASITFAAFEGESSAATGSNADNLPESDPSSETSQTPDSDMSAELATSSNAQGIIVEFEDYEDEESPMELICVEEDTPIEDLPLPETLAVSVQKVEQQSEIATPSDAGQNTTQNTAPDATSSDADQASPSDADTDDDLIWEDEIELINDLEPRSESQESAQESMEPPAINPDAETISIDLSVGWVQAEGEEPYTGEGGQSANFIPTWDYEAYPLAEGYEPNLFVTVLVGDYPSLDQLETDGEKAISFVFSDEDTQEVEDALEREIPAAHGSVFNPLMRFFKAADDYRFDNYYILYENNLGTEITEEVQHLKGDKSETKQMIKYQIDFHSDVQYGVGEVEIRVPYVIYRDRADNPVVFSDIGIPKEPAVSKYSSFSYRIEGDYSEYSRGEIVITNNKVIRAGSNNFLQIFYALDDMMTRDEEEWEIIPKLTIQGEVQNDAGRSLIGSMDTEVLLTTVEENAYAEDGKPYYPELYTVSQVERALKRPLQEPYKTNFEQYHFVLWQTKLNAEASVPWELTITNTPETDGQVVGQYLGKSSQLGKTDAYFFTTEDTLTLKDIKRYGFGTEQNTGLDDKADLGQAGVPVYLYTVAAYPKSQTNMENKVVVELENGDDYRGTTELTSTQIIQWKDYVWEYEGDKLDIEKHYGQDGNSDNIADSWLRLYQSQTEKGEDTELPGLWTLQGILRGYQMAKSDDANEYEYTLITSDGVMQASSPETGETPILLSGEDYYYSEVTVRISDHLIDEYEDTTSVSEDGSGAVIEVKTKDTPDTWQKINNGTPVPYKELQSGYTIPQEWLEKGIYQIRVEHTADTYSTECQIQGKVMMRHNSPVLKEMLEKKAEGIQLDNQGTVSGSTNNPKYTDTWPQKITASDVVTLTHIQEISEARISGTARKNTEDSQVDLTYQLTAYEGYRGYEKEVFKELEKDGLWPVRNHVVFYSLLPEGITFNPSQPVTAGYLTSKAHQNRPQSWITEGVTADSQVIDNYQQSGRQMVIFTLDSSVWGRDNLELEAGTNQYEWWSGWGVKFDAYYPWENAETANHGEILMAYQAPEATVLGNPSPDDGSWAEELQSILGDLDGNGKIQERNILWDKTGVSLDSAVSGQGNIQKTVKEDADVYGAPERCARVRPGETYTYTLTLNNGKDKLQNAQIFDFLEMAVYTNKDMEDPDVPFEEDLWKGTFVETDVTALKEQGIEVKVYYSGNKMAYPDITEDDWILDKDWTQGPEAVQAIAYDFGDYELKPGESLTLDIKMKAPETISETAKYTYNSVYYLADVPGNQEETVDIISDYTRVELYNASRLEIEQGEVTGAGAPKETQFPFLVEISGVPYAYQSYKLYERQGETWIPVPGTYGTNRQGILFLKEGQKAVFTGVPEDAPYKVTAQSGLRWKVEAEGNEGILNPDSEAPNYARFTSAFHPLLYFETEVLSAPETLEDDFTFSLEIDGTPAAGHIYYKVNPAGDVKHEPEMQEPYSGLAINQDGTFTLKAGERICLLMEPGQRYEIQEISGYGPGTDYDCEKTVASGRMKEWESYSYAKISNIYRYRNLTIYMYVYAKDSTTQNSLDDIEFTVQIKTGKDKESLEPYAYKPYILETENGEEEHSTNDKGEIILKDGQQAVFQKMERGIFYQIKEIKADGKEIESSDFRVRTPAGGTKEGFMPENFLPVGIEFENRYKLQDLIVENKVVYPSDLEEQVQDEEFTFTLEYKGVPAANMSYERKDDYGYLMAKEETGADGTFILKSSESAEFGSVWEGDDYRITMEPKDGYIQTIPSGGSAAEGLIHISDDPTTVLFESRTTQSSLQVKKTVNPADEEELKQEDLDQTFPFYLTVGNTPWGNKPYSLAGEAGEAQETFTTDADGGFKLKHNQTAVFAGLPYGVDYYVTEAEQQGYCQISPENGMPADGTVNDEKVSTWFLNQRKDDFVPGRSLVIETELADGEGVPKNFTQWLLKKFNYEYDAKLAEDSVQDEMHRGLLTQFLIQVDGLPYNGSYEVLGPGNRKEIKEAKLDEAKENGILTCYPGQKIRVPNLKIGSFYKVEEISHIYSAEYEGEFPNENGGIERIQVNYRMEQTEPENYGAREGTVGLEDSSVMFENKLYGLSSNTYHYVDIQNFVDGESISDLYWKGNYENQKLVLKLLKKGENGNWIPAEGVRYQVYSREEEKDLNDAQTLLPYPIQETGSDGIITLTPFKTTWGKPGGMRCLLHLEGDCFETEYRIEEVAEQTTDTFGVFAGIYYDAIWNGEHRIAIHHVTSQAESLKVQKLAVPKNQIAPDQNYKFQLTSGIKHEARDYELPYLQEEEQAEKLRSYRLIDESGTEILDGGPFKTDENGIFYLQHGQTAVFEGLPEMAAKRDYDGDPIAYLGRMYHVKELTDADCEITVEKNGQTETSVFPVLGSNEVVMIPGQTHSVTFISNYERTPGLTIYNQVRGKDKWRYENQEFIFTLDVEGAPYANQEYRLFWADSNAEVKNMVSMEGITAEVPWKTNEYGQFPMKAGQYVKFDWIGSGKPYEISAAPLEDFVQVIPAAGTGISSVIERNGNTETFLHQYTYHYLNEFLVRNFLSIPPGLDVPEELFQFQIKLKGKEYSLQKFQVYDITTNRLLKQDTTDADGKFSLGTGQYAMFESVKDGDWVEYEVRELPHENPLYQILSPTDGIARGSVYGEGFSFADFVNGIASFLVTKTVTNAPGNTAPAEDEFTFEVKTDGSLLVNGRYWLYNSQGERVDDQEHRTGKDGRFTLKAGQKALFIGLAQGTEYEVRELPKQYYTQIVPTAGGSYEGIVTDQTDVLVFENLYSKEAALSVTKEVRNSLGETVSSDTAAFTFQLHVNGKGEAGRPYTLNDSNKEYRTGDDGQFQLRHGDTAHFRGLRDSDLCVIKEVNIPDGYQADVPSVTARMAAGQSLGVDVETGAVSPGVTEETQVVFVNRKVPTIWVENTTGDDTEDNASDDDQGGMVAVLDAVTNTIIQGSENKVSSGGTENNTVGRYQQTSVAAIPESGWEVSLEDTTFGPMGADGESGALYRIGDLDFYDPESGKFSQTVTLEIEGVQQSFTINGTLELAEDGQATVTIDPLPFDMDIGFCFKAKQYELPKSGGSGNLPFALTGLALMYLSAWELKRRKRRN